jgi:hypothetical protein
MQQSKSYSDLCASDKTRGAVVHVSFDRRRSKDKNMQQSKSYSDLCASDKTLQSLLTLISVLVTEIQQRCVCGAGKCSFSPRTWSGWIPVTSTGMRRSNKPGRVSRISTDLRGGACVSGRPGPGLVQNQLFRSRPATEIASGKPGVTLPSDPTLFPAGSDGSHRHRLHGWRDAQSRLCYARRT